MRPEKLPKGLAPMGVSNTFTEASLPEALQREHALSAGRWAVLHVLQGAVCYFDLADATQHPVQAPDLVIIGPETPHRLILCGPLRCRIDFFCDEAHAGRRRVLIAANDAVVASFRRCEEAGEFAQRFYSIFLNSSPEIAPHFERTDFRRQRKLLRGSVYAMVTRDPCDKRARETLERIGATHSRRQYNVPPPPPVRALA